MPGSSAASAAIWSGSPAAISPMWLWTRRASRGKCRRRAERGSYGDEPARDLGRRLPMRRGALRDIEPAGRALCLPLPGMPEAVELGLRDLGDLPTSGL